jgi:ATP-binding cassette subfamily B protein
MGFAGLLVGRLDQMMWFAARLFAAVPNLQEYFDIFDSVTTVEEFPAAPALRPGAGQVRFRDVSFAYPGAETTAALTLGSVNFTAQPGSVIALVGQTGAGKTTAMKLLQRMWDPAAGCIEIDGQDIRFVNLDSLREAIGVVFQESMLFARSIRENLLIGKPDATQAELEAACRLAEAHEFILRQPQGYETLVGEHGATLSGGQRQRLAIARALLKDPPILILDEATSALDAATEAKVSRALRALMAGRTTFIIAHRLSTVRDADKILVFDNGRIRERGTYADLIRKGGLFAELVDSQLTVPVE